MRRVCGGAGGGGQSRPSASLAYAAMRSSVSVSRSRRRTVFASRYVWRVGSFCCKFASLPARQRVSVFCQSALRIRFLPGFIGFPFPVISRGVRFVAGEQWRRGRRGRQRRGCQWPAVPRHGLPDKSTLDRFGAVLGYDVDIAGVGRVSTMGRGHRSNAFRFQRLPPSVLWALRPSVVAFHR